MLPGRRLVEAARAQAVVLGGGLVIWCDTAAKPNVVEVLTADLAVLGVPHHLMQAVWPPRWPHRRSRPGADVRVRQGPALETLRRQAPLAVRRAALGPLVDSEFDLAVWSLDAAGAEVPAGAVLGLAADWPTWHAWQAAVMGLACAGCSTDLRPRAAGNHRRAYRARRGTARGCQRG
ncbi:hypothetical protein ACFRMQ_21715 [Kitasatospora sp. NPDC056783]|uniref:hypothetical protein n=1 Tax=Kitasatospora sp. NPDC056783 TaxID=3345943 RepID=UPI00367DBFCC